MLEASKAGYRDSDEKKLVVEAPKVSQAGRMMARTTNQKAGKEVRVARQQTVKSEPRTLKQNSSKSRELLTDKENATPESSIIKPGGALAKPRAKSPTRAQTPPILQR